LPKQKLSTFVGIYACHKDVFALRLRAKPGASNGEDESSIVQGGNSTQTKKHLKQKELVNMPIYDFIKEHLQKYFDPDVCAIHDLLGARRLEDHQISFLIQTADASRIFNFGEIIEIKTLNVYESSIIWLASSSMRGHIVLAYLPDTTYEKVVILGNKDAMSNLQTSLGYHLTSIL
jgi:hypothetical protein